MNWSWTNHHCSDLPPGVSNIAGARHRRGVARVSLFAWVDVVEFWDASWLLVIGCWRSVVGHWLSIIDCWSLTVDNLLLILLIIMLSMTLILLLLVTLHVVDMACIPRWTDFTRFGITVSGSASCFPYHPLFYPTSKWGTDALSRACMLLRNY